MSLTTINKEAMMIKYLRLFITLRCSRVVDNMFIPLGFLPLLMAEAQISFTAGMLVIY